MLCANLFVSNYYSSLKGRINSGKYFFVYLIFRILSLVDNVFLMSHNGGGPGGLLPCPTAELQINYRVPEKSAMGQGKAQEVCASGVYGQKRRIYPTPF